MKYKFRIAFLPAVVCLMFSCSCSNPTPEKQQATDSTNNKKTSYSVTRSDFGKLDTAEVSVYTLSNASGMQVKILNYGAIINSIMVPDKNGKMGDVVLGYDSLGGYRQKTNPYIGALVGRYGNRIANAQFTLDGRKFKLSPNDHGNTLHGGWKGFDKVIWKATVLPAGQSAAVKLQYRSVDGEEGYPGNLDVQVVYSLTNDNALHISYEASTDQPTPVNLTNHSYFNLGYGIAPDNLNHEIRINADSFTEVNAQLIPTGRSLPVKGTIMDFTGTKKIGQDIAKLKGGYDHNYILARKNNDSTVAVSVYEPLTGRVMEMYTSEPGVQFYTGNFLDGSLTGKNNVKYIQHYGFCLEAQHFPDSPNQPAFPGTILRPGQTYKQETVYKFSVR